MADISRPENFIYEFLREPGESKNIHLADGAASDVVFAWTCKAGFTAELTRVIFSGTAVAMKPLLFGKASALASGDGCLFKIHKADGTVRKDLFDGEELTMNFQFAWISGVDANIEAAAGTDAFPVRATFTKAGGKMHLEPGESIRFTVRSNIATATAFSNLDCNVHGHYHPIGGGSLAVN